MVQPVSKLKSLNAAYQIKMAYGLLFYAWKNKNEIITMIASYNLCKSFPGLAPGEKGCTLQHKQMA